MCERVMGLCGLKTHAGLHVHIHPNVCLGLSANGHPWTCPQEWDVQKGVFVLVYHCSARAHGLCMWEQVSARSPTGFCGVCVCDSLSHRWLCRCVTASTPQRCPAQACSSPAPWPSMHGAPVHQLHAQSLPHAEQALPTHSIHNGTLLIPSTPQDTPAGLQLLLQCHS